MGHNMKLLREMVSINDLEIICEDIGEGCKKEKRYKLRGPMVIGDVENKNGRTYPKDTLSKAVNIYNEDFISKKRALGTLDHGSTPTVDMSCVSHVLESLEMKDNIGYGVARVLSDLPMGKILATLIKEGILIGMSSRAVGNVGEKGIVQPDLVICSVDAVHSPSGPGAFMENIYENKEYIIQGNQILEVAVVNLTKKMDNKYNSNVVLEYMMEFMDDIKKGKRLLV